jgi:hypothetical protein
MSVGEFLKCKRNSKVKVVLVNAMEACGREEA